MIPALVGWQTKSLHTGVATALCSDSVMNYWPFNTHSRDSVIRKKGKWDERERNHAKMAMRTVESNAEIYKNNRLDRKGGNMLMNG